MTSPYIACDHVDSNNEVATHVGFDDVGRCVGTVCEHHYEILAVEHSTFRWFRLAPLKPNKPTPRANVSRACLALLRQAIDNEEIADRFSRDLLLLVDDVLESSEA